MNEFTVDSKNIFIISYSIATWIFWLGTKRTERKFTKRQTLDIEHWATRPEFIEKFAKFEAVAKERKKDKGNLSQADAEG